MLKGYTPPWGGGVSKNFKGNKGKSTNFKGNKVRPEAGNFWRFGVQRHQKTLFWKTKNYSNNHKTLKKSACGGQIIEQIIQ